MERAEGASMWRVDGDAESNGHDRIEVDGEGVRWEMRAFGEAAAARVEASDRGARRFMGRVLGERRRAAQRGTVRPAPKRAGGRRRRAEPVLVECPGCGGEGELGCGCCGGEGWVSLAAAETWRRG